MKNRSRLALVAAIAATATSAHAGGWAVLTVHDLPAFLVAGKSRTIEFTIRSHGQRPFDLPRNLFQPVVTLKSMTGGFQGQSVAERIARGRFRAVVTAADTGLAEIVFGNGGSLAVRLRDGTLSSGMTGTAITLLPLRVVAAGTVADPLPPADWGRQLFVAKGCMTCHMKQDDPTLPEHVVIGIGPSLAKRQFDSTWLAAKLANPAGVPSGLIARFIRQTTSASSQMPNLGLSQQEITALVSYINKVGVGETNDQ